MHRTVGHSQTLVFFLAWNPLCCVRSFAVEIQLCIQIGFGGVALKSSPKRCDPCNLHISSIPARSPQARYNSHMTSFVERARPEASVRTRRGVLPSPPYPPTIILDPSSPLCLRNFLRPHRHRAIKLYSTMF